MRKSWEWKVNGYSLQLILGSILQILTPLPMTPEDVVSAYGNASLFKYERTFKHF